MAFRTQSSTRSAPRIRHGSESAAIGQCDYDRDVCSVAGRVDPDLDTRDGAADGVRAERTQIIHRRDGAALRQAVADHDRKPEAIEALGALTIDERTAREQELEVTAERCMDTAELAALCAAANA